MDTRTRRERRQRRQRLTPIARIAVLAAMRHPAARPKGLTDADWRAQCNAAKRQRKARRTAR